MRLSSSRHGQMIHNLAIRGTVDASNDGTKFQSVDVRGLYNQKFTGVEVWHPYGFTSRVQPPGADKIAAEALLIFPGGSASHPIALQIGDRRYRIQNLAEGEMAIHDDQGQTVHLTRTGITVTTTKEVNITGGTKITMTAPKIALVGEVHLGSADASRELSLKGTIDSAGHSEVTNLATKVYGV